MLTYEQLKHNEEIRTYIVRSDESLKALGYTEHSFAHVCKVAETAKYLLEAMGHDEREIELARIAAYLHDIGNLVNRVDHSQSGAIMAFRILDRLGMPADEIATVVTAIGNHDEGTGVPVSAVAAALILADKSDVRRSRVRNADPSTFDIHDRVNYSVTQASLTVDHESKNVLLSLEIESTYSSVMDYFEIFLDRMILCRKAAQTLGLSFRLKINGQRLL
jgi:HD superfamily phosphodiesterase